MKIFHSTFKREERFKMKITYVASECAPFAASGGLGDVMGALPQALKKENKNLQVKLLSVRQTR